MLNKKTYFLFAAALIVAAPATAVSAQDNLVLAGDVKLVKTESDAIGNVITSLIEPKTVVPGDRLIFTTQFSNPTNQTVTNFIVTNPLPSAVSLSPMADPGLVVSVDGGATWGRLSALQIEEESGFRRSATHDDVTHIRWKLANVAPQESGSLEYPAIVR